MSIAGVDLRRVRLISAYSVRYAIRGGTGLVFAVLTLFAGLMIANGVISPAESMERQLSGAQGGPSQVEREALTQQLATVGRTPVRWALGGVGDEAWLDYLLLQRPALVSAVFLLLMLSVPMLIAVGVFNQFSGEIGDRSLRYQLLRAGRSEVFLGRFLGASLFAAVLMLLLVATVTFYVGAALELYTWPALIQWGLINALVLTVLCLPYVALCSWISATTTSPFVSLAVCGGVIGAIPIIALVGGSYWGPVSGVGYLLPWGIQRYLLHHDPWTVAAAMGACVAYAGVYLLLGNRHFARRDL